MDYCSLTGKKQKSINAFPTKDILFKMILCLVIEHSCTRFFIKFLTRYGYDSLIAQRTLNTARCIGEKVPTFGNYGEILLTKVL